MSAIDHVGRGEFEELKREIRALQTQSPLESSSVTGGRVRFIGGLLRVDSGGRVEIVGTLEIDGLTTVTGTFHVNGPWNLAGDGTISGNVTGTGILTWNGPWNLAGAGTITGDVGVTGDITVLPGGLIKVGDMIIDPAAGGSVSFPGGAMVQADPGGGIRMVQGANRVYVGPGLVSMQYGSRNFSITGSSHQIGGLDTIPSSLANGAEPGCIWTDGTGEVFEVVTG